MDSSRFRELLREKVTDFAVSHYLIGMSENKSNALKKKQSEEAYKKLEDWIMACHPEHQEINTFVSGNDPVPANKDQMDLDF